MKHVFIYYGNTMVLHHGFRMCVHCRQAQVYHDVGVWMRTKMVWTPIGRCPGKPVDTDGSIRAIDSLKKIGLTPDSLVSKHKKKE